MFEIFERAAYHSNILRKISTCKLKNVDLYQLFYFVVFASPNGKSERFEGFALTVINNV